MVQLLEYSEFYMSAYVLLNLLNELGGKIMRDFAEVLLQIR